MKVIEVLWVAGTIFWIGFGLGAEEYDWRMPIAAAIWPASLVVMLLWGNHSHRRWFCRLTHHTWRRTLKGIEDDGTELWGRQCTRCWTTEP